MNTYYEIKATIDGDTDILFGSFSKADCQYELQAEKVSWKDQGYANLAITSRDTDESPDPVVYADDDDVDTSVIAPVADEDPDVAAAEGMIHFFASCALGWATASTRDEAIEKLVNSFRREYKSMIKGAHKSGNPGAYVWTCQVNAPADTHYQINFYAPVDVDTQDGQEHAVTYLTDKAMAHTRDYHQEVNNLRTELADLKAPVDAEDEIRKVIKLQGFGGQS